MTGGKFEHQLRSIFYSCVCCCYDVGSDGERDIVFGAEVQQLHRQAFYSRLQVAAAAALAVAVSADVGNVGGAGYCAGYPGAMRAATDRQQPTFTVGCRQQQQQWLQNSNRAEVANTPCQYHAFSFCLF